MTESRLTRNVMKMLRKEFPDVWCWKASDRWTSGIPDIIGCLKGGYFFAVELKIKPNKATKLQEYVLEKIRAAGGVAGVCYSVGEVRCLLKKGNIDAKT